MVDVGCGTGTWCAEFLEQGVRTVLGVDGAYVDKSQLMIPPGSFLARDLAAPLRLDRTFDLAISMEVAEHLPPERGASFVDDLTRLAPIVLFSAAIPGQGGTSHVNEQWPSYWDGLFRKRGFRAIDCLRARFWDDPSIDWWYRQNMFLFVREDRLPEFPAPDQSAPRDIVHPVLYRVYKSGYKDVIRKPTLGFLLRSIPGALFRSFRFRVLGIPEKDEEPER